MQEKEIWKDIPGYEGLYQISNLGRVKSLDRIVTSKIGVKKSVKGKIMKNCINGNQYSYVNLSLNKKFKSKKIHRLIAIVFIPNPENKPCVNHKDGNKLNNSIDNLEWVTMGENQKHAYDTGLKIGALKGKTGYKNHLSKTVMQMDLTGNLISEFGSVNEATRMTGVNNISACCKNKRPSAGGYKWKYKN
jgi:hypothetical protein